MSDLDNLVFLVAEGCPGCKDVKKVVKDKAKIMDVTKEDKATKMAMDNNINSVPSALYKNKDGVKKCDLKHDKGKLVVDCDGKEIKIDK